VCLAAATGALRVAGNLACRRPFRPPGGLKARLQPGLAATQPGCGSTQFPRPPNWPGTRSGDHNWRFHLGGKRIGGRWLLFQLLVALWLAIGSLCFQHPQPGSPQRPFHPLLQPDPVNRGVPLDTLRTFSRGANTIRLSHCCGTGEYDTLTRIGTAVAAPPLRHRLAHNRLAHNYGDPLSASPHQGYKESCLGGNSNV